MHPPVVKFGLEVHHAQGVSLEARKRGNAQPVKRAPELPVERAKVFGVCHRLRLTCDYLARPRG